MTLKEGLKAAGWRIPTPHELLGLVVVLATAAEMMDFFPATSPGSKLCALVVLVASLSGIASAKNRLPDRVKRKLEAFEALDGKVQP